MIGTEILNRIIRQTDERGRDLRSLFFRRGNSFEYIKAGSSFHRVHPDQMVEIADVLSVGTDAYGIPHVRYQVSYRRPNRAAVSEGQRTLALKSFVARYTERAAAH